MKYTNNSFGAQSPYPDFNIPPEEKGRDFCMQYARAAYFDWGNGYAKGIFSNNGGDYERNRMYALGKQPINNYKKWLGVDDATNNTWLSVDWRVRAIISGYRDKAIARLVKEDYGIVATPVDMLAKSEMQEWYARMTAKLAVRQLMVQQNPDLASHPQIKLQSGEPLDMEELGMRVTMGEQFNRAKDAELAIALGMYENDYVLKRKMWYEDLFDYGVAGYCEWLGDDNKPKFRRVDPQCVIVSYCKDQFFSDMVHAGEQIDVPLVELATLTNDEGGALFNDDELQEFASSLAGKWGNPLALGSGIGWLKPYDKFKCKVFDVKFYTYNDRVYKDTVDENGNADFRKADYGRGKKSDKYSRKRIQYVYKCKWIVGTDKCYDYGMCYDQKRSPDLKKKALTKLPYTFVAYNYYEMHAQSFMEKLIPYCDDYQLTMLKIQNFKNRAVPSGWWIDLDRLENVALSKGGAAMQPKELLQMFFETGVLVGRSTDAAGNPLNGSVQPVIPIENTAASELAMLYQDLVNTIQAIERMTGFNDATMGAPDPKTLTAGYELANQSTSNSLYPLAFAEEYLSLKLAEDVLCRMQQGIKKGGISGYANALNKNMLQYIEVSPDISDREYGIMLQKKSTEQDRMWLMQMINADIVNGVLDTSDAIQIIYTHNVKEAMSILAYRVKKAKEQMAAQKMAELQSTNQANLQATQMAQQAQFQALNMELQAKVQINKDTVQADLIKEQMKIQADLQIRQYEIQMKYAMNQAQSDAKVEAAHITGSAKMASTAIAGEDKHISDTIKGLADLHKQKIANEKPVNQSSKK